MEQGIKGMGLFFAGWIFALTTYYLGSLDTGLWIPIIVTGIEILGLSLMIAGIGQISKQHRNYSAAGTVVAFTLIASLAMGTIQVLSLGGITNFLAIASICLALTGDILFMTVTGLVLLGLSNRVRLDGNERGANQLAYLWAVFLTFAILYLIIQAVAVLLINQGLSALTYVVPAMGFPLLVIGIMLIVRIYKIHTLQQEGA